MSKIDVHVNVIDEKDRQSQLFYRCRTTEIRVNGVTFKTPLRPITRSELNAKKNVPVATPLLNDKNILFLPYKLSFEYMKKVLTENEGYKKLYDDAKNLIKRGAHSPLPLILIQPSQQGLLNINRITYDRFLRMTFNLQTSLQNNNNNLLTIPYLGEMTQIDIIRKIHESVLKEGMQPIFFLDLKHDEKHFKQIVDFIKDENTTGAINLLGLIFHQYEDVAVNYDYVWDTLKNEKLGIIMSDVKRKFDDDHLSSLHFSEYRLGDVFCIENRTYFVKQKVEIAKININFFDRSELTVKDFVHNIPDADKIAQDLDVENSSKDKEYLNILFANKEDKKKLSRISHLSKVHEVVASKKELTISRDYIDGQNSVDYIKDKKPLYNRITGLFKYT